MTSWSNGEVTLTMRLSWTWSVRRHPTPQYGQMVSVRVCASSFQRAAWRRSNSARPTSAPVGQTAMQFPQ